MSFSANNRARSYVIACSLSRCCYCAQQSPVIGLVLPCGHETLMSASSPGAADVWEIAQFAALLFLVTEVSANVLKRLQRLAPYYRLRARGDAQDNYWMNHCICCGEAQDDMELYCEPGSAFAPISAKEAARVRVCDVAEPCQVRAGGYACAPELLAWQPCATVKF